MLAMSTVSRIIRATLVCAALVVVTTGAVLWTQGYRAYVVHTGSMSPTYKPGDVVIDKPAHGHLHAGEVITFRYSATTTDVVTHRIADITKAGVIHTKGDADRTVDPWEIHPDQVKGKVAGSVRHLGYLLVFLHQPAGDAAVVTAALGILMLWKVFLPEEPTQPSQPSLRALPGGRRDLEDDAETDTNTEADTAAAKDDLDVVDGVRAVRGNAEATGETLDEPVDAADELAPESPLDVLLTLI